MTRLLRCPLVVVVALMLAGSVYAQPKPKELIVGKWERVIAVANHGLPGGGGFERKIRVDFTAEGMVTIRYPNGNGGFTFSGTYAVLDDEELECTLNGAPYKYRIKVNEKELSITGTDGGTSKFARVK
jgi:hypothetical protein